MKLILKQSDRNQNRKQLTFSFHKRIYTTQIRRKLFQNSHDGLFQRIPLKILKNDRIKQKVRHLETCICEELYTDAKSVTKKKTKLAS